MGRAPPPAWCIACDVQSGISWPLAKYERKFWWMRRKNKGLTSSSPLLVLTESMLWLSVTPRGASMSWSEALRGLLDPESCRALLRDGGVAAGVGDRSSPRGCRPLFVVLKAVSTIHASKSRGRRRARRTGVGPGSTCTEWKRARNELRHNLVKLLRRLGSGAAAGRC